MNYKAIFASFALLDITPVCHFAEEDSYADKLCDASTNMEQTENGFRLSMAIPSVYFKYIIGKKGDVKRRLENDTKTQIRIPRQGEEGHIGNVQCSYKQPENSQL